MNVLSLRINAVRSDDNVKRISQELLQIEIEDFWPEEINRHFTSINKASKTEYQLREIKTIISRISRENSDGQNEKIAKKFVSIYFTERVKHPVKSSIQSGFNQSSERDLLVECIEKEIQRRISSISSETSFHFIGCLNEASQNFHPAIKAIGKQATIITSFIKNLVQVYNEQLNDDQLSPAEANKVSHQLHCSIQACIFCIKAHFNDSNELDDSVKSEFAEIATKCTEMLDNPRIPMDTKNNCSMLIILHSKLSCNEDYLKLVADDEGSPTKKLCIIFGVINAMAKADVNYKVLADMSLILKECYMKSSIEPPLMLSISRSMMQITKKLVVFDYDEMTEDIAIITDSTLSIAFLNIQHHLDTVRHLARDSLRNLSEIASKQQDGKLIECIFKGIGGLCLSSQSIIIFSIAQVTPAKVILEKLPHLLSSILSAVSSNQGTASNFINCYEAVAVKSLEEFPFNESFNIFAVPALNEMMRHQPQSDERLILESLLMALGKNEKKILEEIMKRRESFDIGFTLLCLSTLKKMGLYEKAESSSELWRGIVSFKEIQNAMINANESVRSSSFALVAESRKTTEGFMQQELDCIIYFLNYNINVQSPSMRQSILGIVKNLFIRIRAIVLGLTRRNESAEFYFNFLVQLQEFCLENLFEGANFTRRVLSLRILFYVVDAFAECFCDKAASVWDQNKIDVLMNVLNDSYEANKEMAVEIMKSIPKEILRRFCCISLNHLETMVKSIKPPENITATYLIEVKTKFALNLDEFDGVKSIVSPESLLMLTWCEDILIAGLEIAEKSLSVAASTNPLYGLIQSIRHLLSKLNLKALGGCMLWRDFFKRLIVLCKRLTRVVAPVVNNSSPEGILPPEEFQGLEDVTRKEWMRIAECTTPQIILLCSWRTIKEVSLLLGDVCLKAPIISNDTGLLEVEQILNIGDHFLELLSKTKHRGAFEQCFFGFSQLCMRLWTCHEPELHKLPSEMLHQMITSISGHDKENNELLSMKNLTATRRSAGLPFMIQALITSELKVSTNKNFHFVMKNLMNFCLQGEYLETRTHSLNILRALFRCSDLNEAIGEYIADGIKCAILGIGAESWVERNSSTLLFSALMVRIFGVQRTKDSDDLGIRNRMTGRVFFLRYPLLFDFFMLQLNEAAEYVKAVKMNAKLHPLLLLLIRLYPSALEGSATKLELAEFVPVVALCSGCVEIQTRILCAKFIASATPPDQLMTRITSTLNFLGENEDLPANIAHGILLQILYLVKSIATAGADKEAGDGLIALLQDVCLMGHRFNSQLICYGTFLDIVIEVLEKCWHRAHDRFTRIKQSLDSCRKFDDKSLFGSAVVMKKLFLIEQIKFYLQYQDQLDIIPDHPYLFDSFINNVLLSMDLDYALAMQEEYELNPKEIFFIKNLPANTREKLRDQRRNDQSIKKFMLRLLKDVDCQIKAYDVLSLMKYNAGDVTQSEVESLIETAREAPEHYKHVLLKFANTCIRSEMWIERFDFKFLVEISTDASFYVKSAAADFVESLVAEFKSIKSFDTMMNFAKTVLLLLMDDDHEIRERTATIVMQLVGQPNRNIVPVYAQEVFIEFLVDSPNNLGNLESMAIVLLIAVSGSNGENHLDENVPEYRVFDKKEVNIFSETFIVKKLCSKALQRKLKKIHEREFYIKGIITACQKFSDCENEAIEKHLQSLLS